jgi:hypothetical protein
MLAGPGAVEGPIEAIRLSDGPGVDRRLRGIDCNDRLLGSPLKPAAGDEILAAGARGPLWVRSRDPVPRDRVASALPELEPDEVLYTLLGKRPVATIAVVEFLRSLTPPVAPRPVRAAFVFDDPNIRRPSYGFIEYRRLVEHADAHRYHAAMAMVPLDAGRPHRSTAALFARRRDRLSLVCHGNDHVRQELLRSCDPIGALAIAAQAARRLDMFEQRWGVAVDRVMMPPHGMCSREVSAALGMVGFDALCAIHPRPWTGDRPTSPSLAAWQPAEFVGGCAVIPRIPLFSTVADIAVRAFLDHPIVIYGHHEDLAGGLDPLAAAAARVNRMGDVSWCSLGEIALGNHVQRIDGDSVVVRPFARRLRLELPAAARTLTMLEPEDVGGGPALRGWSVATGAVRPFGVAAPVAGGRALELRLHGACDVHPGRVAAPAWRPWPRLRRAATELRDRTLPLRLARAR